MRGQDNELRGLPEEARQLVWLEELVLDRCPMTALPDHVAPFTRLRVLSLQQMQVPPPPHLGRAPSTATTTATLSLDAIIALYHPASASASILLRRQLFPAPISPAVHSSPHQGVSDSRPGVLSAAS